MSTPMPVYTQSFIPAEPWMVDAACLDVDPDIFFPTPGDQVTAAQAKQICDTCKSETDCLAYALRNGETQGIWGGKTKAQRAALLRRTA